MTWIWTYYPVRRDHFREGKYSIKKWHDLKYSYLEKQLQNIA